LVPARTLADAAKSLAHSAELSIALSASTAAGAGEGIIGFSGVGRRATSRLLDAQFPPYRTIVPSEWQAAAEIEVAPMTDAVRRVALVADRGTPVKLEFSQGGVALSAGGDDEGRAEEQLEVSYEGEPMLTAFNPQFLLDGLGALGTATARMSFTLPSKPVVLRPIGSEDDYTYVMMPVRLPG
jgi:DNA polymerase-3 subunit beta